MDSQEYCSSSALRIRFMELISRSSIFEPARARPIGATASADHPQPTIDSSACCLMLRNYLTIAWRNMMRQKGYTLINVFGLAIGLATTTLIVRYIQSEFSVDRWHSRSDRIYRVLRETRSGGESVFRVGTSGALANAIEQSFPEVEEAVRIFDFWTDVLYAGKASRFDVCIADTTIFKVFDYPFVSGSVETAFPNPRR